MIAIILASGTGSRLMPLTKDIPKSLVRVNSKTIIDIEIENILYCGINRFIITTGYKEDKLRNYVRERYPNLDVIFVENEKYDSTNYIYSMWLTKNFIDDDILLLHGDMVFDKKLLKKLLNAKSSTSVLVNNKIKPPEKDFKAVIENNIVKKIGVNFFGDNAYFSAPIYKFEKARFIRWLEEIDCFIRNGNIKCYAEDAFNKISDEIRLVPTYYNDGFCMEIDDMKDLKIAKSILDNVKKERFNKGPGQTKR